MNQEKVKVIKTVWRSGENGWSVVSIYDSDHEKKTMVGNFHELNPNEELLITGEWFVDPKYGLQLKAAEYEIVMPTNLKEFEEYLGSGVIKGVRKKIAKNIVTYFGDKTLDVIEKEPERLAEIPGISKRKAELIGERIKETVETRNLMIFLYQYNISATYAVRLYDTYGKGVYRVLKENPYQIIRDVRGIGFKKADEIALSGGIKKDDPSRISSGLEYALEEAQGLGHLYLTYEDIVGNSEKLLNVSCERIESVLSNKIQKKELVAVERYGDMAIYNRPCYQAECNVAKKLALLNVECEPAQRNLILEIERGFGVVLDVSQREAVTRALSRGVSIITGGPGTGKTQTTKIIVEYLERKGLKVMLAAPTGRAAKRMSEVIHRQSSTIHRLLEVEGREGGGAQFARNEENPIEADVILIDEASMIDIFLMNSLLKAVQPPTRICFIGDINQLPSVGPGNVLKDMIESGIFAVGQLTKIFRQSEDSTIAVNAYMIKQGKYVDISRNSNDFFFIRTAEKEKTLRNIVTMVKERIPQKLGISYNDIQVLTQMYSRTCGVDHLNDELQEVLNPPDAVKKECDIDGRIFREGDKVMQLSNNYKKTMLKNGKEFVGVFNGDTGVIQKIDIENEYTTILFDDDALAVYTFKEMRDLTLSYAATIHKSQGSEYPCVVIPMQDFIPNMSSRNLLYTAITRAKSMVVLIGQEKIFRLMCNNRVDNKRNTGLRLLLQKN